MSEDTKKARTRGWTKEQIELLKEGYKNDEVTIEEISILVDKSVTSVCLMAKNLNLKKRTNEWTEEDDEFLIRVYPEYDNTILEISESIGKSVGSIRFRANKLGLKRQSESEYLRSIGKKRCKNCNEIMPFENFIKNRAKTNGIATYCISCDKILSFRKRRGESKQEPNKKADENNYIMKQCSICKEIKLRKEFYETGNKCKLCRQKQISANRISQIKENGYCK